MSGGAGFRLKPAQHNPGFCPNFLTNLTCRLLPRRWTGLWSYSAEEGAFSNWRRLPIPSFPDSSLRKTVKPLPEWGEEFSYLLVGSQRLRWPYVQGASSLDVTTSLYPTLPWGRCLRVILRGKLARSPNGLGFHYFSTSQCHNRPEMILGFSNCLWNSCMKLTSCLLVVCNVPSPLPGVPLPRLEAEWTSFSYEAFRSWISQLFEHLTSSPTSL